MAETLMGAIDKDVLNDPGLLLERFSRYGLSLLPHHAVRTVSQIKSRGPLNPDQIESLILQRYNKGKTIVDVLDTQSDLVDFFTSNNIDPSALYKNDVLGNKNAALEAHVNLEYALFKVFSDKKKVYQVEIDTFGEDPVCNAAKFCGGGNHCLLSRFEHLKLLTSTNREVRFQSEDLAYILNFVSWSSLMVEIINQGISPEVMRSPTSELAPDPANIIDNLDRLRDRYSIQWRDIASLGAAESGLQFPFIRTDSQTLNELGPVAFRSSPEHVSFYFNDPRIVQSWEEIKKDTLRVEKIPHSANWGRTPLT